MIVCAVPDSSIDPRNVRELACMPAKETLCGAICSQIAGLSDSWIGSNACRQAAAALSRRSRRRAAASACDLPVPNSDLTLGSAYFASGISCFLNYRTGGSLQPSLKSRSSDQS